MTYRIEWTCTELDEAMLVRGHWWWKRCAMVYREVERPLPASEVIRWRFRNSDFQVAHEIYMRLESARTLAREHGHEDLDWARHRTKRNTQPFERIQKLRLLKP